MTRLPHRLVSNEGKKQKPKASTAELKGTPKRVRKQALQNGAAKKPTAPVPHYGMQFNERTALGVIKVTGRSRTAVGHVVGRAPELTRKKDGTVVDGGTPVHLSTIGKRISPVVTSPGMRNRNVESATAKVPAQVIRDQANPIRQP